MAVVVADKALVYDPHGSIGGFAVNLRGKLRNKAAGDVIGMDMADFGQAMSLLTNLFKNYIRNGYHRIAELDGFALLIELVGMIERPIHSIFINGLPNAHQIMDVVHYGNVLPKQIDAKICQCIGSIV